MKLSKNDLCSSCRQIRPRLYSANGDTRGKPLETLFDGKGYNEPMVGLVNKMILQYLEDDGGCSECINTLRRALGISTQQFISSPQSQLCPKCGGELRKEFNLLGSGMSKMGEQLGMGAKKVSDFLACIRCSYAVSEDEYRPVTSDLAPPDVIQPWEQKIIDERERAKKYNELLTSIKTASTERAFQRLAFGFEALALHQEYADKGVHSLAWECEEKYLVKKYQRLCDEKKDAKTEDESKQLSKDFAETASELRSLVNKIEAFVPVSAIDQSRAEAQTAGFSDMPFNINDWIILSEVEQDERIGKLTYGQVSDYIEQCNLRILRVKNDLSSGNLQESQIRYRETHMLPKCTDLRDKLALAKSKL